MASLIQRGMAALTLARKGWNVGNDFITNRPSRGIRSLRLPNSNLDYERLAGDLWNNSAVAACLQYILRNMSQAPVVVKRKTLDGWEVVPDHPVASLVSKPNSSDNRITLLSGCNNSWYTDGNGFIRPERAKRSGLPAELWYIPHKEVEVVPAKTGANRVSHFFHYPPGGLRVRYEVDELIHFKFGIDPDCPYLGMAPLKAGAIHGFTDNEVGHYAAAVLKNRGIIGGMAFNVDDNANDEFDPETFVKVMREKTTGDKRGEWAAFDRKMEIVFPDIRPDNMAIDKFGARDEARICALIGIASAVVGFSGGMEQTKVGATLAELREESWEGCILPNSTMMLEQIGEPLIRAFGGDTSKEILSLDISEIRPLQPDKDKLHDRARKDWMADLIDRATWKTVTGGKVEKGDIGVYYSQTRPQPMAVGATSDKPTPAGKSKSQERTDWAARVSAELEVLHGASA